MVKCVVPGCNVQKTRRCKNFDGKFFPIPSVRGTSTPWFKRRTLFRRRAWLFIINDEDLKDEYAPITSRICNRHFVSGKPSELKDDQNIDWLPSLHVEGDNKPTSSRLYLDNHTTHQDQKPNNVHYESVSIPHSPAADNTSIPKEQPLELYSTFVVIKEELPDTQEEAVMEEGSRLIPHENEDMVTVRCDDYKIMEEELQRLRDENVELKKSYTNLRNMEEELERLRNENADLKKSYTKLRNQLTEADVDKLELNAELSDVKRGSKKNMFKNRSLMEENVFLTNKIISCDTLVKTLQEEAKTHVNKIATLEYNLNKVKGISVCIEAMQEDEDYVSFYTGLPFYQTFETCLSFVRSRVNESRSMLAPWQCFLLTLTRLKLSLTLQDLAYRFGVSRTTVCNTFDRWLYHLYQSLDSFITRPEREDIKRIMTDSFKEAFSDKVVMILHCCEFLSDNSRTIDNRGVSQPNAKPRTTIKFFIGMTPCGAISFVSRGWDTRESAVQVLEESGFYETLQPGDEIMSDHRLPTCENVGWCCVKVMDSKGLARIKFSCQNVNENRRMSMLRGQVDRIGSLRRKFRILRGELPIQDSHKKPVHNVLQTDQIVRVCCALSNIAEKNALTF